MAADSLKFPHVPTCYDLIKIRDFRFAPFTKLLNCEILDTSDASLAFVKIMLLTVVSSAAPIATEHMLSLVQFQALLVEYLMKSLSQSWKKNLSSSRYDGKFLNSSIVTKN